MLLQLGLVAWFEHQVVESNHAEEDCERYEESPPVGGGHRSPITVKVVANHFR